LLDEQGMPKMHAESLDELFNKKYYSKQQSLWDTGEFSRLLGQAAMFEINMAQLAVFGLAIGLLIGLVILLIFAYKRKNSQ
jgi:manganese oxidase